MPVCLAVAQAVVALLPTEVASAGWWKREGGVLS